MSFEDLDVYKLSLRLASDVYLATKDFPKSEMFGLTSQIRRSAVSISCNIAEGAARNNPKEFIQFVGIARGSCAELVTLFRIAEDIALLDKSSGLKEQAAVVAKMLTALLKSLRGKSPAMPQSPPN